MANTVLPVDPISNLVNGHVQATKSQGRFNLQVFPGETLSISTRVIYSVLIQDFNLYDTDLPPTDPSAPGAFVTGYSNCTRDQLGYSLTNTGSVAQNYQMVIQFKSCTCDDKTQAAYGWADAYHSMVVSDSPDIFEVYFNQDDARPKDWKAMQVQMQWSRSRGKPAGITNLGSRPLRIHQGDNSMTIPEGIYFIVSQYSGHPGWCIDIPSQEVSDQEGDINKYFPTGGYTQKWHFIADTERPGRFIIKWQYADHYLGIDGNSNDDGAEVKFFPRSDNAYQSWRVEGVSGEIVRIINDGSEKAIDFWSDNNNAGDHVRQKAIADVTQQFWILQGTQADSLRVASRDRAILDVRDVNLQSLYPEHYKRKR